MKVERIELREVGMALRERFEISSGFKDARRVLLIQLTADGVTGWGECVVGEEPNYSYETTDTAWHILTDFLIPAVVGSETDDARTLAHGVPGVRGHAMAKAAIEMAAWGPGSPAGGTIAPRTWWEGSGTGSPSGVSIGLQPTDEALIAKVQGHLDEGYSKIKIKIKPGRDVEMLTVLREAFPDAPFMADANSAYTLEDVPRLKALDDLNLMMIEQPLHHDDLSRPRDPAAGAGHAGLPGRVDLLGGGCEAGAGAGLGPDREHQAGTRRRFRSVHRDPRSLPGARCRSLVRWHARIGRGPRAHTLALATLPGFVYPGDISASRRYWEKDIVNPEFVLDEGHMAVPNGLGMGVEPDLDGIEDRTDRLVVFEA